MRPFASAHRDTAFRLLRDHLPVGFHALLASGHCDVIAECGLQPYDYLALVPVIEGAGGVVTDWNGAPLGLDSDGRVLAAATPELHDAAMALLRG